MRLLLGHVTIILAKLIVICEVIYRNVLKSA